MIKKNVTAVGKFIARYWFWIVALLGTDILVWAFVEHLWGNPGDVWTLRMYLASGLLCTPGGCSFHAGARRRPMRAHFALFVHTLMVGCLAGTLATVVAGQQDKRDTSSGSAFAVDKRGKLLTNSHVVERCSEVSVIGRNDESRDARVEARDARNDLALLSLDSPLGAVATFRPTPVRSGEDVIALGFPLRGLLSTDLNVSKGIVSATAGLRNDTSNLQISAAIQPGNSGGPLLDSAGAVVGVVVAKLDAIAVAKVIGDIPQNVNFAIKAEVAQIFLRSNGVEPVLSRVALSQSLAVPDAVEQARLYSFIVECDPSRLTAQQRAAAERAAAEAREAERRRAAEIAEEQLRAKAREEERQRVAREADAFWAAHNVRAEDCHRPTGIGIGTLEWNRMSATEQWAACRSAGTIRPHCPGCSTNETATTQSPQLVRVVDAGFASERVDLHKASLGAYRNSFKQGARWISMYVRVVGLTQDDDIELSIFDPSGTKLNSGKVKLEPAATRDSILWIGKQRSVFTRWAEGQYMGRISVTRRGVGILNFATTLDIR